MASEIVKEKRGDSTEGGITAVYPLALALAEACSWARSHVRHS